MKRGYVRVSTVEQNEDRQVEALTKQGVEVWYTEKVSGKNMERPELQRLLSEVQAGDIVFIHDFSRLARSTKDLLNIIELLLAKDVHLVSNKENIDTSTPSGKLMVTVIGAINEFERTNMLERQREGIAIAKRKGIYKGGKKKEVDEQILINGIEELNAGNMTKTELAKELGVSRPTLDKLIKNMS